MIDEEVTRRREPSNSRSSGRRQYEEEELTGLAKYFDEHPGAKKATYILAPIVIVLLCALIFWGSWKFTSKLLGINSDDPTTSTVQLVDVKGKSVTEAKQALDAQKVKYEVTEEYNAEVAQGNVISQDPAPGTNYDINKNRPVRLVVSKGVKIVEVPAETTVGKKEEDAKKAIEAAELKVEVKKETSMTVEEGIVIKQDPEPGTKVDAGSTVVITVSAGTGLEKVSVPYVVDKDIEAAKKELTEKKLEVNVMYEENTSKSNGIVLKQSLEVGKVVDEGTAITLTVNKIQEIKQGTVNIHVKSLTGYKEPVAEPTNTTNTTADKNENKAENKTPAVTPKAVSVRVKVDEESVYNEKVLENTEVVNVTVKGKGTITVKVYIDEVLKDTRQMDLNSDNRVIDIK